MADNENGREPLREDGSQEIIYINPEFLKSAAASLHQKQEDLHNLMAAAEDGDLEAQERLAACYMEGSQGAPKDERKGAYWFQQAARGGSINAQLNLGVCYERGVGVERDPHRAAELYQ